MGNIFTYSKSTPWNLLNQLKFFFFFLKNEKEIRKTEASLIIFW
jgi:hypothetical protein